MENLTPNRGLPSPPPLAGPQQAGLVWRPWTAGNALSRPTGAHDAPSVHGVFALNIVKLLKPPQFIHPVKLLWPKSRRFDYLYQEAETLLRNYPVQATICLYEESSSEEEGDDEEEEEEEVEKEKELN